MLTAITSIFLGVFVYSYDGRAEYCEPGPALAGEGGGFAEVCVTGLTRATFAANFGSDYGEDPSAKGERLSFGAVLAIFFPAVSGTRPTTTATRIPLRLLLLLLLPPLILSLPPPPPPPPL